MVERNVVGFPMLMIARWGQRRRKLRIIILRITFGFVEGKTNDRIGGKTHRAERVLCLYGIRTSLNELILDAY